MNFSRIRTSLFCGATLFSPVVLLAQNDPMGVPAPASQPNQPQQQSSATSMQDSAANAGDVGQIMKDKIFLRSAAEGGIAEATFGQLAVQRSSSDAIKAFAQQ